MAKIGSDVLQKPDIMTQPPSSFRMGYSTDKVYVVLKQNKGVYMSISEISRKADISWVTARNAINELIYLGLAEAKRVGNSVMVKLKE